MAATANDTAMDLARAAHRRADEAHTKASAALDGSRSTYEAMGDLTREMAGLKGQLGEVVREVRESTRATNAAVRTLQLSARNSHAKLNELGEEIEDTKVRNLRKELAEAKRQLAKTKEHHWKWIWWWLGIVAAIVTAAVASALGLKK